MNDVFASLYEWFGLMPLYKTDMGDHLRGFDISCSNFDGTPWYVYIGWIMAASSLVTYAVQYHLIDSSGWNKKHHWWLFALILVALNFLIAFSITFNTVEAGDFCKELNLSVSDCIGFGFSNAIWSLLLFMLISTLPFPRRFSSNCRNTTFWKP